MHGLEMPKVLAGPRIQCQQAVSIQVVTLPVSTIELILRGGYGKICNAVVLVDRDFAPDVDATHVLVRVFRPRVVTWLSRTRNCMENPEQFTRDCVERTNISRRGQVSLTG